MGVDVDDFEGNDTIVDLIKAGMIKYLRGDFNGGLEALIQGENLRLEHSAVCSFSYQF